MEERTRYLYSRAKRIVAVVLSITMLMVAMPKIGMSVKADNTNAASITGDTGETPFLDGQDAAAADITDLSSENLTVTEVFYNGKEVDLKDIEIMLGSGENAEKLIYDSDYTLICVSESGDDIEIKNAGTYKLKITGKGNYSGDKEVDFVVKSVELEEDMINITPASKKWSQNAEEPVVAVIKDDVQFIRDTDYTVEYAPDFGSRTKYNVTVAAKSVEDGGSGNLNGFVGGLTFELTADENIKIESVIISGVVEKETDTGDALYYYSSEDNVKITADSGYQIKDDSDDIEGGTLNTDGEIEISENASEVKFILQQIDDNGNISGENEIAIKFKKDNTAPTMSENTNGYTNDEIYKEKNDSGEDVTWAAEIKKPMFTVTDNEDGVGGAVIIYKESTESDDAFEEYNAEEAELVSGKTYLFYTQDELGNRNATGKEISIPELDDKAPAITVKENGKEIADGSKIYYNKESFSDGTISSIEYVFECVDEGSGLSDGYEDALVKEFAPVDLENAYEATIKNTLKDNVGNETTHTFTAIYDPQAPVISQITAAAVNGVNIAQNSGDAEVITGGKVKITAEINENYPLDNESLSGGSIKIFDKDSGEQVQVSDAEIEENGAGSYTYTCTLDIAEGEYLSADLYVSVTDKAGNVSKNPIEDSSVETVKIIIDKAAPVIGENAVSINKTANENGWIKDDFTFTVNVTDENNNGEDIKLKYRKAADEDWTEVTATHTFADNVYAFVDIEEIKEAGASDFDETFNGKYEFMAYDSLGNIAMIDGSEIKTSYPVKKDKKAPDYASDNVPIYVDYKTDENTSFAKKNGLFSGSEPLSIFAKAKTNVTIYIHDDISGVSEISYTYNGINHTQIAEKTDGVNIVAQINVDGRDVDYSVISFQLLGNASGKIKITEIKDNAGNVVNGEIEGISLPEGADVLIIDNVPPVVEASYPEADYEDTGNGKKYKYYSQGVNEDLKTVSLTFTEANLIYQTENGETVLPDITMMRNGAAMQDSEVRDLVGWNGFDAESCTITAEIKLPFGTGSDGEEIEYVIKAAYSDGSGNKLEKKTGSNDDFSTVSDEEGYVSNVFVLDNKVPQLCSFEIIGNRIGDGNIYEHGEDGSQATVKFAIDDKYFIQSNLKLVVRNVTTNEEIVTIDGKNQDIKWETEGSKHSGSYVIKNKAALATCRAELSYNDKVGNKMTGSSTALAVKDGTYISGEIIFDETAPIFNIGFSEAYRLVKNGSTSAINDKSNVVPATGYTAYYNTDAEVVITVDEHYAVENLTNGEFKGIQDFVIRNVYDKNNPVDLTSKVVWTKSEGMPAKYTGTLKLTEEGSFQLEIGYRDAAGNNMVLGDSVQGNSVNNADWDSDRDRVYTSVRIVIDKNAPVVTTKYVKHSDKPDAGSEEAVFVNQYEENGIIRNYYNEKIDLLITVDDGNVRYNEFIESLIDNITVKKNDGSDVDGIENIDAMKFLSNIKNNLNNNIKPEGINENGFTLRLPLSSEGNYDIPIVFEDLAGNVVTEENSPTQHVCVDMNEHGFDEAVYVTYKEDLKQTRLDKVPFVKGLVEKAKKLFYKDAPQNEPEKEITVSLYITDEIAGIEKISYEFNGEAFEIVGATTNEGTQKLVEIPGEQGKAYQEFTFTVTGEAADNIKLLSVTDRALNTVKNEGDGIEVTPLLTGDDLIVIDNTAPCIEASYPDADSEDTENGKVIYKYYSQGENEDSKTVNLTFTEANLMHQTENGEVVLPYITIIKNGEPMSDSDVKKLVVWKDFLVENCTKTAEVKLPFSAEKGGEEIEYVIKAAYSDGSGNVLTAKGGSNDSFSIVTDEEGYASNIFVLDSKVPELTSYVIDGATDRKYGGEIDVYKHQADENIAEGKEVTIKFSVDDNDKYWDPGRLSFNVYNETTGVMRISVKGDDEGITWDDVPGGSRIHTGTYVIRHTDAAPATYHVEISYSDKAANTMTAGSDSFIFDETAPVFNIGFGEAYRLVKDNNTFVQNDRTGVPTTGYTAYYNTDAEVVITIDEHYAVENQSNKEFKNIQDFIILNVYDKENPVDLTSEVVWTKNEGMPAKYTGTLKLTNEGSYVLQVNYRDAAANNMVLGDSVQGNSEDNAGWNANAAAGKAYTSVRIVVDKTAPDITLKYVKHSDNPDDESQDAVIVNTYEESGITRDYYNEQTDLLITVNDENVRYNELIVSLIDYLTIKKNDGSNVDGIENTDIRKFLDNIKNGLNDNIKLEDIKENEFTLRLPLSSEGNYDIPVVFEDLAGNVVTEENSPTQHVCVDMTKPEHGSVYVSYEKDLKGMDEKISKIPLAGKIYSLFYKEKAEVTLYVTDEIAGVKAISYEFNGKTVENVEPVLKNGAQELVGGLSGESDNKAYQVFTFTVSGDAVDKIKLISITDRASNTVRDVNDGIETITMPVGTQLLVIDNTAPTLNVKYPAADNQDTDDLNNQKYKYYSQKDNKKYEEVVLTYTEANYAFWTKGQNEPDDEIIKPVITIKVNDSTDFIPAAVWDKEGGESLGDINVPTVSWELSSGVMTATLYLPYSDEADEVEYVIASFYEDGSENKMVFGGIDKFVDEFAVIENKDGNSTGNYKSSVFVLDNRPPVLTSYAIAGKTDEKYKSYTIENGEEVYKEIDVYQHNDDEAVITFIVDDNNKYWDPGRLSFDIYNETIGAMRISVKGDDGITWADNPGGSRMHTGTYVLKHDDAYSDAPAVYHVSISYDDKATNKMTAGLGISEFKDAGTYISEQFILDEVAPVFNIEYDRAYRLVNNLNKAPVNDKQGQAPETGYTAYYNSTAKVEITIDEHYAIENRGSSLSIGDFTIKNVYADGPDISVDNVTWTRTEGYPAKYIGTVYLEKEGNYQLEIGYRDTAANNMVLGDSVQGNSEDNAAWSANIAVGKTYTSVRIVVDKTAPRVSTFYSEKSNYAQAAEVMNIYEGRNYYKEEVDLLIGVEDNNVRTAELKGTLQKLTAKNSRADLLIENTAKSFIDGISEDIIEEKYFVWVIGMYTQANYDILIDFEDLAGNRVEPLKQYICVDKGTPEFTTSYSVEPLGVAERFIHAVNYKDTGFLFADRALTITASAKDETAGIRNINFKVSDADKNNEITDFSHDFAPVAADVHSMVIPWQSSDFNGTIDATVTDWSNNQIAKGYGYVVESASKHSSTGSAVITNITGASRNVGGIDFYNGNVELNIDIQDNYSGIRSYMYQVGSAAQESHNYADEANILHEAENFTIDDYISGAIVPVHEITHQFNRNVTLVAGENNANDVVVMASFVDNAGHTGEIRKTYNVDITAPTITVEYDNNTPANEIYYNAARTATVTITERNFDPNDVVFTITNTFGTMPSISDWSTSGDGDGTTHVCHVVFGEDGDYTFTVAFQDMAGNHADYSRVDSFTIDRTMPVYTVTYDNNNYLNDYYYDAPRTATIDITEHNFDASLINIVMTARNASTRVPAVNGWTRNGDHNIATIHFNDDAEYTFDISGVDLAENALEDYAEDHFVVDTDAPEIEIYDIENMSANNGIVMPGIRYSDINYDESATVIAMNGYNNGLVEMNGNTTRSATGVEIKLNDFEHVQEMDDLYTMDATVYDLAGNSTQAGVMFSVNRFGSVYSFDDNTAALIGANGRYYTNAEQELVITETNVDTLEFRQITCDLNGDLHTLEEGVGFTVEESGSDVSWKQYTYHLAKENFISEGTYIVTIYSEDRATNKSNNSAKGKKVEFVVDKTTPSILISGVEQEEQYRENERRVTLDVEDNVLLSSVDVIVNGVVTVYDKEALADCDGKIELTIGSSNHWQTLSVKAYDAAGNEQTSEELRFLITANMLVQFYMNKPLFYGTVGGVAVVLSAAAYFFVFGKKKKKEEA